MWTAASRRPMQTAACSGQGQADCTNPIALCGCRGYITAIVERRPEPRTENHMRAEIERLVEEIKQSVGLLRRHL